MEDKTRKLAIAAIVLALIGIAGATAVSVYQYMLIENSVIDGATISDSQFTGNFFKNTTYLNQTLNNTYINSTASDSQLNLKVNKSGDILTGPIGLLVTTTENTITIGGSDDSVPVLGTMGGKVGIYNDNGRYGLSIGIMGTGDTYLQSQTTRGGAQAFNILLNPSGGNVGIGTTGPTSPLHVVGIPAYANDADAGTAGLTTGAFWQVTGTGVLMVKQ